MKFKLNVIRNGEKLVWSFDNLTNTFYDENGKELLTEFKGSKSNHFDDILPFTRFENNNIKNRDLYLIEIQLGSHCNFKCKYCSQTAIKDIAYNATPKDVDAFIDMLRNNVRSVERVQLWGGEPLVYWKTIRLLIPKLKELYPNLQIYILTNGSLLTRSKVDFFNEYGVHLYISHDGPGNTKNRVNEKAFDVLENPKTLDAILYAKEHMKSGYLVFNSTPSSGNINPSDIIRWFKEKIGNDVRVCVHNIVRCHNSADEESAKASILSEEELKTYSEGIFEILSNPDLYENDNSLRRKVIAMIEGWVCHEPFSSVPCECTMPTPYGITVNLRGDLLQCHNHPIAMPSSNHIIRIEQAKALGFEHPSFKKRCRECLVVHGCKGGCPVSDDKASAMACPNLYALWYGIFKSAVGALFGVYLESVEKCQN